jgi:flavin reductase (DIM6/NTAB) family NADH-FMN oxidoreductase RutF
MKKINVIDYSAEILDAFKSGGVFLNSKLDGEINSMVMGWGSMSVYWGKPVLIAPVRLSRYTHDMIEKSEVFTVSIPAKGELRKELGVCGTKSRRDIDKFDACGFTAKQGQIVDCPVIGEARLHIECKVVAQTLLTGNEMDSEVVEKWYGGDSENGDFHDLFFGEIVDAYILD